MSVWLIHASICRPVPGVIFLLTWTTVPLLCNPSVEQIPLLWDWHTVRYKYLPDKTPPLLCDCFSLAEGWSYKKGTIVPFGKVSVKYSMLIPFLKPHYCSLVEGRELPLDWCIMGLMSTLQCCLTFVTENGGAVELWISELVIGIPEPNLCVILLCVNIQHCHVYHLVHVCPIRLLKQGYVSAQIIQQLVFKTTGYCRLP